MSEASRDYNDIYMPTIPQQKAISLLILPFCFLSFLGSASIARYILKDKKRSAYRRLMLAISICDMISTFGFALQSFLGPADSIRPYVYYMGNDATCTVLGAFTQFSWSTHLYTASLSFYFLLTVRYGMRDEVFARKCEPFIHFVVISFSVSTAIAGVFLDVYHESETGASCWVSAKPGEECWNDSCGAEQIAWIFGGIPNVFCFFSVTFNNILLYRYVRRTIATSQKNAMRAERRISRGFSQQRVSGGSTYHNKSSSPESHHFATNLPKQDVSSSSESKESDEPRLFGSFRKSKPKSVLRSSDRQWERVRQVGVQSFLYVTSYILCFGPTVLRQILDGRGLEKQDGAEKIFLPLLLIQCVLLPSQGIFFCIIFFRPKYLQNRKKQPTKPRVWAARSAMETVDKRRPTATKVSRKATKQHVLKAVDENNAVEDADVPGSLAEMSDQSSVDSVMPSVASRVETSRPPPSQGGRRSIISILSGANNNNNSRSTATSASSGVETTSISNASDLKLSSTSAVEESSSSSSPSSGESNQKERYLRIDGFDVPGNSSQYST